MGDNISELPMTKAQFETYLAGLQKQQDEKLKQVILDVNGIKANVDGMTAKIDGVNVKIDELRTATTPEQLKLAIETILNRVGTPKSSEDKMAEIHEKNNQFIKSIMLGQPPEGAQTVNTKDISIGSNVAGGFAAPPEISTRIIERVQVLSPILQYATVERTSASEWDIIGEDGNDFTASFVGETQARPATTTGGLRASKIPVNEIYTKPKLTQRSILMGTVLDLEGWATRKASIAIAKKLGMKFVKGAGGLEPKGLLQSTGAAHTASTAYKATVTVKTGDASNLKAKGLRNLFYALPQEYASNGVWLMNRTTLGLIAGLEDSQGRPLIDPYLQNSTLPSIFGRPVVDCPDMPDVSAGTYPIIFGDISRAYTIPMNPTTIMVRDNTTDLPNVGLYTAQYYGGQAVDMDAYVAQVVSA